MRSIPSSVIRSLCVALYALSLIWVFGACPATKPPDEKAEGAQEQKSPPETRAEATKEVAKEPVKEPAKEPVVADKGPDAGPDGAVGKDDVAGDQASGDGPVQKPPHPLTNKVEKSRYEKDLTFIAESRAPGTPHWQKVQDLCATRFKEHGFAVELHKFGVGAQAGINVIGVKAGTKAPKEQILISAHYDSVPNCAGADDNATGVAGVLEAARVLGQQDHDRTLVVACWDQEEAGLLGSKAYALRAMEQKQDIKMHFVFEMIGFHSDVPNSQQLPQGLDFLFPKEAKVIKDNQSRGDFIALIGDTGAQAAGLRMSEIAAQITGTLAIKAISLTVPDNLKNSPLLADLRRSDHAPFWTNNVPAMMITDTSEFRYKAYHCRNQLKDSVDKLNADFATGVIKVTVGTAAELLVSP